MAETRGACFKPKSVQSHFSIVFTNKMLRKKVIQLFVVLFVVLFVRLFVLGGSIFCFWGSKFLVWTGRNFWFREGSNFGMEGSTFLVSGFWSGGVRFFGLGWVPRLPLGNGMHLISHQSSQTPNPAAQARRMGRSLFIYVYTYIHMYV